MSYYEAELRDAQIEELQSNNIVLVAAIRDLVAAIKTRGYHTGSISCEVDNAEAVIDAAVRCEGLAGSSVIPRHELEADHNRLLVLVDKLPKTADGMAIAPGMEVFSRGPSGELRRWIVAAGASLIDPDDMRGHWLVAAGDNRLYGSAEAVPE